MRKITVSGKKFLFKVGIGYIEIRDENRTKKITVNNAQLKGLEPQTFEKGKWKGTQDGMITPREIEAYLKKIGWAA